MSAGGGLALAAALLMGVPPPAMSGGGVIWVGLCDAAHPGTQLPIPFNRNDGPAPGKACHAGCGLLADRRARR